MRKEVLLKVFISLIAVIPFLTACDNLPDPNDDPGTEPPMASFKLDKDGVPYWEITEQDAAERASLIKSEVIGYGWRWNETYEIDINGALIPIPYYQSLDGAGPSHYYIKSNTEMTKYFFLDAAPANVYRDMTVNIDERSGMITSEGNYVMNIFDVYISEGRYYINVIEPLGMKGDGKGGYRTVWAVSSYVRASKNELKDIQDTYKTDYSSLRW